MKFKQSATSVGNRNKTVSQIHMWHMYTLHIYVYKYDMQYI